MEGGTQEMPSKLPEFGEMVVGSNVRAFYPNLLQEHIWSRHKLRSANNMAFQLPQIIMNANASHVNIHGKEKLRFHQLLLTKKIQKKK